ncbi:hypothetical protein DPMN_100715 [Dreissena polymorpha]|uniref:Uncharacterized protein n=1 Tax=Dreissena polymorpha TaxID=45954 RepID=A0A9D4LHK0_DREPO|nr:hypothetical protein DPMN_100715 [Dreissena polymorpha]
MGSPGNILDKYPPMRRRKCNSTNYGYDNGQQLAAIRESTRARRWEDYNISIGRRVLMASGNAQ